MSNEARKETTLECCAREVGIHPSTLRNYLEHARWRSAKFHAAIKQPNWWERLQHDVIEAELDRRVSDVGPPGFAALTDEQILAILAERGPQVRQWVETYDGRSAVLLGPTGIGKSIAAFCVLRRAKRVEARQELKREGWSPASYQDDRWPDSESRFRGGWIAAQDLLVAQRGHPLGQGEASEVRKAKTGRLVVIDDITWPTRHDLTREVMAARYDAGLPTIVTAGERMARLFGADMFGDAFGRRCLDLRGEQGDVVEDFGGK